MKVSEDNLRAWTGFQGPQKTFQFVLGVLVS
jgi:hypothetical protein